MIGSDMVVDGGHQQCLTAAIRAQASVVQTDDPLEITNSDQRHVGRDPELELPATTDVETNMTYANIGAGLVGATLARFSPPRTFPSIANSRGPETLDELAPGIGPRVTPMSAFRPSPHVSGLNRKDCSGSN
jgi:hypothetical protein